MKKTLLSFLFTAAVSAMSFAQVCTPDPNATGLIYPMQPDSTVNPGESYSQTITISVPTDTTVSIITVYVDSIRLDSVGGLPMGLGVQCNSSLGNCLYLGGTTGCFIISGTVDNSVAVGTYPITFYVTITGVLDSTGTDTTTLSIPYPVEVFTMYVGNVGVEQLNMSEFSVLQNIPNPFTETTVIKFNNPLAETINLSVYDMIGRQVHEQKIDAKSGVNTINYNASQLAPGAYFYTLANSKSRITKRMIVSGK